jgi:hypothetical protein
MTASRIFRIRKAMDLTLSDLAGSEVADMGDSPEKNWFT